MIQIDGTDRTSCPIDWHSTLHLQNKSKTLIGFYRFFAWNELWLPYIVRAVFLSGSVMSPLFLTCCTSFLNLSKASFHQFGLPSLARLLNNTSSQTSSQTSWSPEVRTIWIVYQDCCLDYIIGHITNFSHAIGKCWVFRCLCRDVYGSWGVILPPVVCNIAIRLFRKLACNIRSCLSLRI